MKLFRRKLEDVASQEVAAIKSRILEIEFLCGPWATVAALLRTHGISLVSASEIRVIGPKTEIDRPVLAVEFVRGGKRRLFEIEITGCRVRAL